MARKAVHVIQDSFFNYRSKFERKEIMKSIIIPSHRVKRLAGIALAFTLASGSWSPASAQQTTIDGATGILPLATDLLQAYKAKSPSTTIAVGRGSSSTSAMRAVSDGKIAIGLSSDPVGAAERSSGMQGIEIARMAVVFAVNASVTGPANLTSEQICAIYAGKNRNWKEIGGPALSIVPFTRPASESDAKIVRQHVACFAEGEGVLSLPKAGDMAKALASKAGSVGMTNLTIVEDSQGAVKPLALNGITPTAANLENGSYRMARQFYFVVKGSPSGEAAQFIAFVKSKDGERVIQENKAVPAK